MLFCGENHLLLLLRGQLHKGFLLGGQYRQHPSAAEFMSCLGNGQNFPAALRLEGPDNLIPVDASPRS